MTLVAVHDSHGCGCFAPAALADIDLMEREALFGPMQDVAHTSCQNAW